MARLSTLLAVFLLAPAVLAGGDWGGVQTAPSESECRPYIEKALKELGTPESQEEIEGSSVDQAGIPTDTTEPAKEIEISNDQVDNLVPESKEEAKPEQETLLDVEINVSEASITANETGEGSTVENVEPAPSSDSTESTENLDNVVSESVELPTTSEELPEGKVESDETSIEESAESSNQGIVSEPTPEVEPVDKAVEASETDSSSSPVEEINSDQEVTTSNESVETTSPSAEETGSGSEENISKVEESVENVEAASSVEETSTEAISTENLLEEVINTADAGAEVPIEDVVVAPEVSQDETVSQLAEPVEDANVPVETVEQSTEEVVEPEPITLSSDQELPALSEDNQEIVAAEEPSSDSTVSEEKLTVSQESTESVEIVSNPESSSTEVKLEETVEPIEITVPLDILTESVAVETEKDAAVETEKDAAVEQGEIVEVKEITEEEIKSDLSNEILANETASEVSAEEKVEDQIINDAQENIKIASAEESVQLAEEEPPVPVPVVEESTPDEEDLTMIIEIPEKLRPRDHISEILKLDSESAEAELLLSKTMDATLRDLKRLYESAIKPLEILYKYRDLSNRHFGDPEIFSKPLILLMGPWSGGKSTIVNYLLDNEYKKSALRTGAEPSPAYFNIVMWGEREEVLDGTQLAADWTFSGLQKFGQGLLDRLRGLRLNVPLLEKVNIVEIPGILEIRKQVERLFPFNDACQWFIDRADIIFLVYDPSKLDVGPESEAILDQLKGREYQTRIILNKADQVKPEELMRVQGTLIWNISPLMSSTEPPVMYSTSLWSIPYESGAPTRLLYAQEKAFLRDLRDAIDKRVENKIASARRFAVRVRNHAKMVDCYLTTYYNHKSFFVNRKKISDDIIEHPQNYHIYEGLSTLTNISRYDLPDPEVYKDFFRLNPVYDFQQLSATCTYFRGCPINRLDVAIAYDLPELVGKYKKTAEEVLEAAKKDKKNS